MNTSWYTFAILAVGIGLVLACVSVFGLKCTFGDPLRKSVCKANNFYKTNRNNMTKKQVKLYYYFCKECKKAIGRDFKKLKHRSFCEKSGKDTIITLITKRKI